MRGKEHGSLGAGDCKDYTDYFIVWALLQAAAAPPVAMELDVLQVLVYLHHAWVFGA
ncbi:hypothetical protein SCT_2613 [Sulfuricella sp. T08]|nr:hypothetical protein SCT_2613 [Sulfuricella sp. T08]